MLAGLAGAVQAPFFEAPPPVENYLSPFSLGFIAVPILAGIESMLAVVVVALLRGCAVPLGEAAPRPHSRSSPEPAPPSARPAPTC